MTNSDAASNFALELKQYLEREMPENIALAQRSLAIEAFSLLVQRSPVGNPSLWANPAPVGYVGGQFRGNWQLSLAAVVETPINRLDPSGAQALRAAEQSSAPLKAFDTVHIQNNLPYAVRLEEGWSGQAPQGMVALTVEDIRNAIVEVK